MSEPTIPFGEPELWRVSEFRRAMENSVEASRYNALSPSLLADLQRFERDGGGAEVLEVLAACLRHPQDIALHLDRDGHVLPLTVFPRERLFHTPLSPESLYATRFDTTRLLQVERALLRPPTDPTGELNAMGSQCHALGPLLWHLALHGPRHELLPELAGPAVYRIAPDLDLDLQVPLGGALGGAVLRLRQESLSLRGLAAAPGLDAERAARLLNGLYLQAGLIVSRTHPAASGDTWFSSLSNW